MQRAASATVFRGPDSPELLAAQAMYQPAQRHQPFPGVPGSQPVGGSPAARDAAKQQVAS